MKIHYFISFLVLFSGNSASNIMRRSKILDHRVLISLICLISYLICKQSFNQLFWLMNCISSIVKALFCLILFFFFFFFGAVLLITWLIINAWLIFGWQRERARLLIIMRKTAWLCTCVLSFVVIQCFLHLLLFNSMLMFCCVYGLAGNSDLLLSFYKIMF